MAIKIKKKDGSKDSEESAVEAGGAAGRLSEDADPFLRASWETASWMEENRSLVIGGVLLMLVVVVAAYMGLGFLENEKVQASNSLTPAFDSYNTMLEGSKELEAVKSNPDLEAPKKTYKTDEERWQAVYDDADKALKDHANAEIAIAAKLTKAAAAAKLGKYDEAIALYKDYESISPDPSMKVAALQGLATAYAAADKNDEAIKTLDEIAALDPQFASGARYQKARILQHAGKTDEAKKLYHEILDNDPDHPSKADIERRLANM